MWTQTHQLQQARHRRPHTQAPQLHTKTHTELLTVHAYPWLTRQCQTQTLMTLLAVGATAHKQVSSQDLTRQHCKCGMEMDRDHWTQAWKLIPIGCQDPRLM